MSGLGAPGRVLAADLPVRLFDFSAELPSGTTLRLSDFKDKALFFNFWAALSTLLAVMRFLYDRRNALGT
jgi:hypothetical protein